MKERKTDSEIFFEIINYIKSVRFSSWFLLYSFLSFLIGASYVYGIFDNVKIVNFHTATGIISFIIGVIAKDHENKF